MGRSAKKRRRKREERRTAADLPRVQNCLDLERRYGGLVTTEDAAIYLKITDRHVRWLAERGKIDRVARGLFGSRSLVRFKAVAKGGSG